MDKTIMEKLTGNFKVECQVVSSSFQFSRSVVSDSVTPRAAARQGPLFFTVFFMFFSIMVYSPDIAYSSQCHAVGLCS